MDELHGFFEIGQDAAGVVESGRTDVVGIYTGGIMTCLVLAFECQSGLVVVHDSGQLLFSDISALISRYGKCRRMTAVFPSNKVHGYRDRVSRLQRVVGVKSSALQKVPVDTPVYAVAISATGELGVCPHGEAQGYTPLHERSYRVSVTELNNFFLKRGSQTLKIDLQFSNGKYNPIRGLDKTPGEIVKIVLGEPKYFFNNAALLYAAHQLGVMGAPPALVNIVERNNLQRFRGDLVQPHEVSTQALLFSEFCKSQTL